MGILGFWQQQPVFMPSFFRNKNRKKDFNVGIPFRDFIWDNDVTATGAIDLSSDEDVQATGWRNNTIPSANSPPIFIQEVEVTLSKTGSPTGNVGFRVYNSDDVMLDEDTLSVDNLTASSTKHTFKLSRPWGIAETGGSSTNTSVFFLIEYFNTNHATGFVLVDRNQTYVVPQLGGSNILQRAIRNTSGNLASGAFGVGINRPLGELDSNHNGRDLT